MSLRGSLPKTRVLGGERHMRRILRFAVASLWVTSMFAFVRSPAHASTDTFGLGDGHSGALTVSTADTVINTYTRVTLGANTGDTTLTVATTAPFVAGDLILVWQ